MSFEGYHLAQLNVAKFNKPIDDKANWRFSAYLDPINQFGDEAPGFVWRLQDEGGNSTSIRAFADHNMIVNLTVWETLEALYTFVYSDEHLYVFKQRSAWFHKMPTPSLVLWWIPTETIPSMDEALSNLEKITQNGPSAQAFNFKKTYDPTGNSYSLKR